MSIKIIYPPSTSQNHTLNPILSLGVLQSYLESKKINVGIDDLEIKCIDKKINFQIFNDKKRILKYVLNKENKDVEVEKICKDILELTKIQKYEYIGFSIMGINQFIITLALSKLIKQEYGKKIIFGGFYPQSNAKNILKYYYFIDYIIEKEGEYALEQLLSNKKLEEIPFLYHRQNGKIIHNTHSKFVEVNELPTPNYDELPIDLYKKNKGFLEIPYELARGCIANCSFCSFPKYAGLRVKEISKIISDIKKLKVKYNASHFIFYNAELNMDDEWCKDFLRAVIDEKLNIQWEGYLIPKIDEETVKLLAESNCKQVKLGIESGSDKILTKMNKLQSLEDNQNTLGLLYKYGINAYYFFITGFPFETYEDHKQTLRFIIKNKDKIRRSRVTTFELEYNSNMFSNPSKYNIIKKELNKFLRPSLNLPFDEINNLSWEEKIIQQKKQKHEIEKLFEKYGIIIPSDYCI